jgi:hypothetical protein
MIILTPYLIHNYPDCFPSSFMTLHSYVSWKEVCYDDDSGYNKEVVRTHFKVYSTICLHRPRADGTGWKLYPVAPECNSDVIQLIQHRWVA